MPEPIKYSDAIERLDEIISKIENDDIDVDELSLRVKEAIDLIKLCKSKINKAELEVKQVVEHLSADLPKDNL
jgi:exodeoxyribonuclease VII small subunit